MTNPAATDEKREISIPRKIQVFPEFDDDEDEADFDDPDDDEGASTSLLGRRFSRFDFGSPEWWSRT